MKNRILLDTKIYLTSPEEAKEVIQANESLITDLYEGQRDGYSLRTLFFIIFIIANIGMYFLLKNVSPGYVVPKMILGNIVGGILLFIFLALIARILFRREIRQIKKEEEEANYYSDDNEYYDDGKYMIIKDLDAFKRPRLILREHDFTIGLGRHKWSDIRGYTHTDEWIFVMLQTKSLVPIRINNLKEKRRMEILGIFSDRVQKAKTAQPSDEENTNI